MEEIYIGKICNYFGLKGELKVSSNFEVPDIVFTLGQEIIINHEKHIITGVRYHHNNYLIQIDDLKDINLITKYIGYDIFVLRDKLNNKSYLLNDLIGFNVFDNDKLIGKVTEAITDKVNPLIKVNNKFFIPVKGNFIIDVDVNNKKILCKNINELML